MVAWRGPLAFRVYNPDKPDKFGIKIFELYDSDTSYCSSLEFYTGKRPCSAHGATFDVVNRLITPYLEEGRTLFVDNYYTSHDLFTHLKEHKTLACGTLRLNRNNGPPKDMLPKLKKADTTTSVITNGTLNLLRFYDKREVNILSTAHDDTMVATGKNQPCDA
ncbi:PiggyBac transposable element-derived protein 4-like [Plakobranchus ocellatus]|uniref:PiggyBac transposable element-derived protein 4-like n=1 Tax=Plakobranchus ocellatus TaxID=259542 RepID=A0AAV4AAA4_9GAST|nr:PiggyBac transposable element-derived protein 4-like [Plakobranchus ocellatus]